MRTALDTAAASSCRAEAAACLGPGSCVRTHVLGRIFVCFIRHWVIIDWKSNQKKPPLRDWLDLSPCCEWISRLVCASATTDSPGETPPLRHARKAASSGTTYGEGRQRPPRLPRRPQAAHNAGTAGMRGTYGVGSAGGSSLYACAAAPCVVCAPGGRGASAGLEAEGLVRRGRGRWLAATFVNSFLSDVTVGPKEVEIKTGQKNPKPGGDGGSGDGSFLFPSPLEEEVVVWTHVY